MDLAVLRSEFERLTSSELKSQEEVLHIMANYFMIAIADVENIPTNNLADFDAKIILQMMLTKTLNLKQTLTGVSIQAQNGALLNVLDPTILGVLIRNIYETMVAFHTIYILTSSPEEKKIVYQLWVIAGLSYRQRFRSEITSVANLKKHEEEAKMIESLTNEIKATLLFKSLDDKNKNKIYSRIKQKEFLIMFEGTNIRCLNWAELTSYVGTRPLFFDNIYGYFSLYSHPSQVSVFQFAEMFGITKENLQLASLNIQTAIHLLSFFASDFIKLFPSALASFEKMSILHQTVLNSGNIFFRHPKYSINNSWEKLG